MTNEHDISTQLFVVILYNIRVDCTKNKSNKVILYRSGVSIGGYIVVEIIVIARISDIGYSFGQLDKAWEYSIRTISCKVGKQESASSILRHHHFYLHTSYTRKMAVADESNILTTLKILIIGESSVGKSRFVFSPSNHPISWRQINAC